MQGTLNNEPLCSPEKTRMESPASIFRTQGHVLGHWEVETNSGAWDFGVDKLLQVGVAESSHKT